MMPVPLVALVAAIAAGALGVAIAGYLLEIVGAVADQPPTAVTNFYWAFLGVGLVVAGLVALGLAS